MWNFIPLLLILPGILACKQRQRPHWSADGNPDLVKVEEKPDLNKSPSVRGLEASNLIIRDRNKLYSPPTTPRIPTPKTGGVTWTFATTPSFATIPPKYLRLPTRQPGQSIILYKLVGKGKDPLDIQQFSIEDPINVALEKVSPENNDEWNAENEYWWNVVQSQNEPDFRKKRTTPPPNGM